MQSKDIPVGLTPQAIGQVVSIQIFRKTGTDTIAHDSLRKQVGYLEWYTLTNDHCTFQLRGGTPMTVDYTAQYAEVFTLDQLSKP